MPRLVFLLGEDTEGPAGLFLDREHGARQLAFRARIVDADRTAAMVASPDRLETALLQSLLERPRARAGGVPVGRVWNIPARSVEFTGRGELLAGLRAALSSGGPAVVQAVHGMGGVGKTTAAIEYAHRHGEEYDVAWWVAAEDPALVPDGLAELARVLKLADESDPTEVALGRLLGALRGRDRWLVVFDNAEHPAALRRFLPGGAGHVLITSRNPDWRGVATGFGVAQFARAESISLLRSRLPELAPADADRVAEALGDLPLAVDQAAALLADTGMDADSYLGLLAQRTSEVLARGRDEDSEASAAASWAVAFDRLAADDPAGLQLLTAVAWLAPEPVPLTLLTEHPDPLPTPLREAAADPLALTERTATLRRRGMARVTPGAVEVHRVPAALLRARTAAAEDIDGGGWAPTVVRLLRAVVPGDAWNNPPVWPIWRPLLPHVLAAVDPDRDLDDVADEVSWLLRTAGGYVQSRGEPRAARPLFERAYQLNQNRLDADDEDMLATTIDLSLLLADLGEHEQARQLDEDTLTRYRRVLGEDHPDTLSSANNLAIRLADLGEHEQARQLTEDTLTRYRRVLGEDHPDTLSSANNLANDLADLGEHEQARQLTEDALTRYRRVLGEDHPYTLRSANNLAIRLADLGEHEQARQLTEDTLTRYRRVLGEDHPDTLSSANNLALRLADLGEHEQARQLREEVEARRQAAKAR